MTLKPPFKTMFGFRDVSPDEKTNLVSHVFRRVAQRYDLMNDVMSAGLHRLWKNQLIAHINPKPTDHLIDVAGGTGDISFRFLKACPQTHVTLCDRNLDMLSVGRDRAFNQGWAQEITWICGDASMLPVPSDFFDIYTISFGLRNVTFRREALQEAYRVLKPGGRFFCLEFSKTHLPLLKDMYDFYSFRIIPNLGHWIARDRAAYQYLVESIAQFPDQESLTLEIQEAGFKDVQVISFSGGIVALHHSVKS